MLALHIRQLQHHSHFHGAATASVRKRVDAALAAALDNELEAAMLSAGIDSDEEICIRRIRMRSALSLRRSDRQLAADLSLGWVDELRRAIERGGPDVIRYRSRVHLLLDMGLRVACADDTRLWAWQQLGIWPREFDITSQRALALLTDALVHNVTTVIPTLIGLAQHGLVPRLLRRFEPEQIDALAAAALKAAELPSLQRMRMADAVVSTDEATIARTVTRVLQRSPLAVDLVHLSESPSPGSVRESAAILALLAAEPALLRTPLAPIYIEKAVSVLCEAAIREEVQTQVEVGDSIAAEQNDAAGDTVRRSAVKDKLNNASASRPEHPVAESSGTQTPKAETFRETLPIGIRRDESTAHSSEHAVVSGAEQTPAQPRVTPQFSTRFEARSEWGGLLFLLSLVESSGVLESAISDPLLHSRGLRWVLHRMAVTLLSIATDDAAAYAFAGVHPVDALRSLSQSEPTAAELEAIRSLSDTLVDALTTQLVDKRPRELLLHTVCRRSAVVLFDPGWIEVRLELNSVSTAIRRSGLDRDPDWLPWLGAVVRFVYE